MGVLYIVATPIGNLEDITLRAIRILGEVSVIAAEDTRTTRKLLSYHGVQTRMVSYNEHNMKRRTPELLRYLDSGDVALVSEAGTPGISDPGAELVTAAIEAGFAVSPVPGAAAVIAALTASGISAREFTFLGFPPRTSKARRDLFAAFASDPRTFVFYESPHRIQKTFADLQIALGDRRIAVCRELTKLYEEVFRGAISQAIEHFAEPRGEFTVVVEGASEAGSEATDDELRAALGKALKTGASKRDAVAQVAEETGAPHRRVYALSLED